MKKSTREIVRRTGGRDTSAIFDQLTDLLGLPTGSFGSGSGENLLVPGEPAQLVRTVQGNQQITAFSETENTELAHMKGYLVNRYRDAANDEYIKHRWQCGRRTA